jgi:hypothetical protein
MAPFQQNVYTSILFVLREWHQIDDAHRRDGVHNHMKLISAHVRDGVHNATAMRTCTFLRFFSKQEILCW